jgi:biopolymer transport protein ExbD
MPVKPVAFRRRKLSLTSLIDVIFLLLLFFMLSSTFSKYGEVRFLAGAAGSVAPASAPPLFLRLDGSVLSLNGVPVALSELEAAIRAVKSGDPSWQVIVAVAGEATSQALVDVLAPLSRIKGAQVTVVE